MSVSSEVTESFEYVAGTFDVFVTVSTVTASCPAESRITLSERDLDAGGLEGAAHLPHRGEGRLDGMGATGETHRGDEKPDEEGGHGPALSWPPCPQTATGGTGALQPAPISCTGGFPNFPGYPSGHGFGKRESIGAPRNPSASGSEKGPPTMMFAMRGVAMDERESAAVEQHPAPAQVGDPDLQRFKLTAVIALAVGAVPFLWVLWDLWTGNINLSARPGAPVYDLQALAIMHGHLWVPKGKLGIEAFVHDGRQFTYFGVFPRCCGCPS